MSAGLPLIQCGPDNLPSPKARAPVRVEGRPLSVVMISSRMSKISWSKPIQNQHPMSRTCYGGLVRIRPSGCTRSLKYFDR